MTKKTEDYLNDAFESVKNTLNERSSGYKVQPVTYMPIEDLIAQVAIKVERTRQSTTVEKQIEEAVDVIGYSFWLLARLNEIRDQQDKRLQIARPDTDVEEATVSKVET